VQRTSTGTRLQPTLPSSHSMKHRVCSMFNEAIQEYRAGLPVHTQLGYQLSSLFTLSLMPVFGSLCALCSGIRKSPVFRHQPVLCSMSWPRCVAYLCLKSSPSDCCGSSCVCQGYERNVDLGVLRHYKAGTPMVCCRKAVLLRVTFVLTSFFSIFQVYGECPIPAVSQLVQDLRLREDDIFLDLGSGMRMLPAWKRACDGEIVSFFPSGIGNVVLQVAAETRCKRATGIECRADLAAMSKVQFRLSSFSILLFSQSTVLTDSERGVYRRDELAGQSAWKGLFTQFVFVCLS